MSVSEVIARIAALQGAAGSQATPGPQPAGTTVAQRMVGLAQAELAKNVHETPAGSNRSPDITGGPNIAPVALSVVDSAAAPPRA